MKARLLICACLGTISIALVSAQTAPSPKPAVRQPLAAKAQAAAPAPRTSVAAAVPAPDVTEQRALLTQYCFTCHNAKLKTAGLLLDELDLTRLTDHREIAEKVVRKLRAGMMPPMGMPRPDAAGRERLITWMENELDRQAVTSLTAPGLHRLNRTEYGNVIRDLLDLEVDATKFLPSDDSTHGFDNIAGALTMSPALMEAYLSAASKISRLAMGAVTDPAQVVYNVPESASQNYHIEGLPFFTRGGILVRHEFPADGEYVFKITPVAEGNMGQTNAPFGRVKGEKLEVLIDGEVVEDLRLGQGDAGLRRSLRRRLAAHPDQGRLAHGRCDVPRHELCARQRSERGVRAHHD